MRARRIFLYVFLKSCEWKKENALAERVLNLYFGSFASKAGNIARADTDGAAAYLYMRSLGVHERRPKDWRPANPSSLLAVFLLFGAKLRLQSKWNLRALDHRSLGCFIGELSRLQPAHHRAWHELYVKNRIWPMDGYRL
jgi:hypothetical protein